MDYTFIKNYGYEVKNGKIINKYNGFAGQTIEINDGNTIVELDTLDELNAIKVFKWDEQQCKADLFDSQEIQSVLYSDAVSKYISSIQDLLKFQDWTRLNALFQSMLSGGIVTQEQIDAFKLIVNNNGGDL